MFKLIPNPETDGQRDYNRFARRANKVKIGEPGPDQYVAECYFSKTGWGIWNKDGSCTCEPARAPRS